MYKSTASHQITFNDFNQSCGMELSLDNEWCVLADRIDWVVAEKHYAQHFPSRKGGHPAAPLRQALGDLIIQKRMGLSDRALVKSIAENPYYQYFIGLQSFAKTCPFTATTLVGFPQPRAVKKVRCPSKSLVL
ncbi:MAG: transposase [Oligosphaeraceae bacterium]|nr:transposase [Oligosphaeraceae bacterium]